MSQINVPIICFLAIFTFITTGCGMAIDKNANNQNLPEILFVQDNSYPGTDNTESKGTFVDRNGNIREYSMKDDSELNAELSFYDWLAKQDTPIVGQIEKKELLKYYKSFLKVSNDYKLESHSSMLDAIYGSQTWYGFRFLRNGKVEIITIYETGDSLTINTDKSAKKVQPWLFEKLPTTEDVNNTYYMD